MTIARNGFLLLTVALPGCFGIRAFPEPLPVSQLQIRALQSRTYVEQDARTVLKTVLNVLQDDGFLVHYGSTDLGLLDASKAVPGFADGSLGLSLNATANISEFGNRIKVRINFQRRLTGGDGVVTRVAQVTDLKLYQEFFAKLDKGLYLERQGL